ncbi:hypothetical protein [Sphingopyxis sp.]|uniref:hypothetical protein n=1 Tax=Sphingopyxis sp. TaxID=1908224 RepID=UPI002B49898B|nr:hypothetical protein [Sphingopyxis sp.]HJS11641.1 hypothetical protein [Sphingopyxis sp.]
MNGAMIAAALAALQPAPSASQLSQPIVAPYRNAEASGCSMKAAAGSRTIALETSLRTDWRPEASLTVSGIDVPGAVGTHVPVVLSLTYEVEGKTTQSDNKFAATIVQSADREGLLIEGVSGLLRPARASLNGKTYTINYSRIAISAAGSQIAVIDADAGFHSGIASLNACSEKQPPFDPATTAAPAVPTEKRPDTAVDLARLGRDLDANIRKVRIAVFKIDQEPRELIEVGTTGCQTKFRTSHASHVIDWRRKGAEPIYSMAQMVISSDSTGEIFAIRAHIPSLTAIEQSAGTQFKREFEGINSSARNLWEACS